MAGTLNDVYAVQNEVNYKALTTDATATVVQEINVSGLEGGYIEIYCTGITKAGGLVTGVKFARYKKDVTGVLTLTSPTTVLPTTADAEISTANFNIVSQNNNLGIQVTGVAGKNIGWNLFAFQTACSMINF